MKIRIMVTRDSVVEFDINNKTVGDLLDFLKRPDDNIKLKNCSNPNDAIDIFKDNKNTPLSSMKFENNRYYDLFVNP